MPKTCRSKEKRLERSRKKRDRRREVSTKGQGEAEDIERQVKTPVNTCKLSDDREPLLPKCQFKASERNFAKQMDLRMRSTYAGKMLKAARPELSALKRPKVISSHVKPRSEKSKENS